MDEYKKTGDPFKKIEIEKLQAAIKAEANKLKLNLSVKSASITARDKKVLTRTFNRAGLIVPYNKKYVGKKTLKLFIIIVFLLGLS